MNRRVRRALIVVPVNLGFVALGYVTSALIQHKDTLGLIPGVPTP